MERRTGGDHRVTKVLQSRAVPLPGEPAARSATLMRLRQTAGALMTDQMGRGGMNGQAGRPWMPREYAIAAGGEGLLPWS
jgi:hypothetical protein